MSIAGLFFGADAVREALTGQFKLLLGPVGSRAVEAMLKGASSPASGKIAGAAFSNFGFGEAAAKKKARGGAFWLTERATTKHPAANRLVTITLANQVFQPFGTFVPALRC